MDCIFCKIAHRDIATPLIYEDEEVVAFNDINPKAPIHFLIIPKKHIVSLAETGTEDAALLGKMINLEDGLRRRPQNGDQSRPRRRSGGAASAYSCARRPAAVEVIASFGQNLRT